MSSDAKFLLLFLVIALLHLILLKELHVPGGDLAQNKKNQEIEITEVPWKSRQFAFSSKAKEQEDKKDEAKRVGKDRNRVKKETQSRVTGQFRDGRGTRQEEKVGPPDINGTTFRDLVPSASPDDLAKDIVAGDETVLNTDRMLYASFFERFYEQVYEAWMTALFETRLQLSSGTRKIGEGDHVTEVMVALTKTGEVNFIRLLKSCGVPELDEACKTAFWKGGPYRDPPEKMAETDGFIHIGFSCNLRTNSIRFQL